MGGLRFLLDTNILSEPTKAEPDPHVCQKIIAAQTSIATASVVVDELFFGINSLSPSKKQTVLESWLGSVLSELPILPFDSEAAQWHGRERARLRRAGLTPSYSNGLIAAIAIVNDLVLVTRNTNDFRHFNELKVENWFEVG